MKNKIKIFVEDGIVQGVFSNTADVEIEVVYGDSDAENAEDAEYYRAWKQMAQDKGVHQVYAD